VTYLTAKLYGFHLVSSNVRKKDNPISNFGLIDMKQTFK